MEKKQYKTELEKYKIRRASLNHLDDGKFVSNRKWRNSQGIILSKKDQLAIQVILECLKENSGEVISGDIREYSRKNYDHAYIENSIKFALLYLWVKKVITINVYASSFGNGFVQRIKLRRKYLE